jgi:hypothetical protein
MVLILSLSKDEGHAPSANVKSEHEGKRGEVGRDAIRGEVARPFRSHATPTGERAPRLRSAGGNGGGWSEFAGSPRGEVAAELARTIEGIAPLIVKVLCLSI